MTINDYQKKAHTFANYPSGRIGLTDTNHIVDYLYPALGLSEEAGEASGKFAKAIRDNGGVIDELRKIEIVKELGDVCWFVAELATILGVNLETVMEKNIEKLTSRKERGVIGGSGDNR